MSGGRALVTGAGGFLGVHLCRALVAAGWRVEALLRPAGSRWRAAALAAAATRHEVDLTDSRQVEETVRRLAPEVAFHAAARGAYRPSATLREAADDLLMTVHLLDALAAAAPSCRLVVLASSLETGPVDGVHREEAPLRPTTRRGALRAASTVLALQQARGEGRPVVAIRPFHVYGPWEEPRRLVPQAVRAALRGTPLPLAPDDVERDYVFVEDVAEACLLAATTDGVEGELIQVAGGRGVNAAAVAATVERVTGRPMPVVPGAYAGGARHGTRRVADVSRAAELLGWRPRHDLDAGVARAVDWVRRHDAEIPW